MTRKRNRLKIFVLMLVFGTVFVGFVNGSTTNDYIRIISVTPNADLKNGIEQQFTITIEWFLSSQEQAMIYIGFNSHQLNRYRLVFARFRGLIVNRGSGVRTFNVTALTKNWAPNGKFGAYANLSPYPHENSWNPLAYDIKDLSF